MSITLLLECTDNGTMRRFIERLLRDITRLGNFGSSIKDLSGNVVNEGLTANTTMHPGRESRQCAVLTRWQHGRPL